MPTLLIVDDHSSFRKWARQLFEQGGLEVVGDVGDGESAIAAVNSLHPDIVLLDIRLPGIDGFEVAGRLASGSVLPTVVLTSTAEATDFGYRLKTTPAAGFITKSQLSVSAIKSLAGDS